MAFQEFVPGSYLRQAQRERGLWGACTDTGTPLTAVPPTLHPWTPAFAGVTKLGMV